jgi:LacI family transcriptional regulator/LacI family repressor for deo operon, udp, cdd, tsx, nupC, and nupG
VLGGHSRTIGASQETRRRILEAAKRLGYSPSPAAISLSTGKTNTLGLFFSNSWDFFTHPNGALVLVSMCNSAAEQGYRVLLASFSPGTPIDVRLMDACIVNGSVSDACALQLEELARQIPVVSTYRKIPGAIAVNSDGGRKPEFAMAADYLYDLGHRHIVIADIKFRVRPAIEEFRQAAIRRNLDVRLQEFKDEWRDRTYPTIDAICRLDPLPTAVFAFDDDYARALIARLGRDRRRCPEDVSVFSGETHATGFQSAPPLTGTNIFQEQQSAEIVRRLVDMLKQDKKGVMEIVLPPVVPQLIVRQSCATPRS